MCTSQSQKYTYRVSSIKKTSPAFVFNLIWITRRLLTECNFFHYFGLIFLTTPLKVQLVKQRNIFPLVQPQQTIAGFSPRIITFPSHEATRTRNSPLFPLLSKMFLKNTGQSKTSQLFPRTLIQTHLRINKRTPSIAEKF